MRGDLRTAALALGTLLLAGAARAAEKEAINKAIDRGVVALKQLQGRDGTWPYPEIGATALAGLTLLECKVPAGDPAVEKAVAAVRQASLTLTHTYSISLAILFLDRLGDARDIPLIESLTVRLLAGQFASGTWSYSCPPIGEAEVRRLGTLLRQHNELKGGRTLPKPGPRTVRDLPREIQQQLILIGRMVPPGNVPGGGGDNSNTQFATLALWVARRHGLPVDLALKRVEVHFRLTQNDDGGWGYMNIGGMPFIPAIGRGSSAAMTCAGLLGLAVGHGTARDAGRALAKDAIMKKSLLALGTAIGNPGGPGGIPVLGPNQGKAYYFLWSLERVAVALGLETIGKKDWYGWGSDVLLANQQQDGSWRGEYAAWGADTCFALLFLRRANLASDLTARLGTIKDPAEVELRVGGVGGSGLRGSSGKGIKPGLAPEDRSAEAADPRKKEPKRRLKPIPAEVENAAAERLSNALVKAEGTEQDRVLEKMRDTPGVDYTEALLLAIPRLDEEALKKAREALKARFKRLTAKSLLAYMKDPDPEARRAAILASAMKGLKGHIPAMIDCLSDTNPLVVRAADAALKALTDQDFGAAADATAEEHKRTVAAWKAWWRKNRTR